MKTKNKTFAIAEIAIVLCSLFLVALPGIAADKNQTMQKGSASEVTAASGIYEPGPLDVFGNANEDDTIDMRDTTYIKLAIFGKKPETKLADANYDGKISMLDVGQTKLIILGKERELTLLDRVGRIVTVDKPITKMFTYGQAGHQVVKSLKAEDRLILTDEGIPKNLPELFPEISKLPIWGSSNAMDYETVFELKPDIFVFGAGGGVSAPKFELRPKHEEIINKLEPAGIKSIGLAYRDPVELIKTVRILGYVLDKESEADEFIDFFEGVLNTITERTESIPERDKPRAVIANTRKYFLAIGGGPYSTYVEMAGSVNIAADLQETGYGCAEIDPEWVVEQNPEVYVMRINLGVFHGYGEDDTTSAEEVRNDILNTPELAKVKAIQDERIYLFGQTTTAAASFLCIGYMAKWFYPELFEDLDMKAIHQEYLDRFQRLDYDVDTQGVFMYPPLYGPALP